MEAHLVRKTNDLRPQLTMYKLQASMSLLELRHLPVVRVILRSTLHIRFHQRSHPPLKNHDVKVLTIPSNRPTSSPNLLNTSLTLAVCSSTTRAYSVVFVSSAVSRFMIVL